MKTLRISQQGFKAIEYELPEINNMPVDVMAKKFCDAKETGNGIAIYTKDQLIFIGNIILQQSIITIS